MLYNPNLICHKISRHLYIYNFVHASNNQQKNKNIILQMGWTNNVKTFIGF
jgi:hypothetical protein